VTKSTVQPRRSARAEIVVDAAAAPTRLCIDVLRAKSELIGDPRIGRCPVGGDLDRSGI